MLGQTRDAVTVARALGFAVGAGIGAAFVVLSYGGLVMDWYWGGDFASYWRGWRLLLDGGDPYRAEAWRSYFGTEYTSPRVGVSAVFPGSAVLAPLALLPMGAALALFYVASTVVGATGLYRLVARYRVGPPAALLVGLALFASEPARLSWVFGQFAILMVGTIGWAVTGFPWAAWLVVVKPHSLAGLAAWAWLRSSVTARLMSAGVVLVAAVVAAPVLTTWYAGMRGATWLADHGTVGLFHLIGHELALVVSLALVAVIAVRRAGWPVWVATGLVAAPYLRSYDYLLLLPVVVAIAGRWSGAAVLVLFAVFEYAARAALVDVGQGFRDESWTVLIAVGVLACAWIAEGRSTPQLATVRSVPSG